MIPPWKVLTQEGRQGAWPKSRGWCSSAATTRAWTQRLLDEYQVEEISIGDYVLTGGELPAMILTDAVARMLPGVLSEEACFTEESHYAGLLEYPSTPGRRCGGARPVPPVLLSGHHGNIQQVAPGPVLAVTPPQPPRLVGPGGALQEDKKLLEKLDKTPE